MRFLFSSLLMLVLFAVSGGAQTTLRDIHPDQRVRLDITDVGRTVGRFVAATADTLVVIDPRTRERVALNLESIRQVEVYAGRRTAAGVGGGLLIGLVGGVGLGMICAQVCEDGALAPVGGLFFGPPIGAIAGALLAPAKWRVVVLRPPTGGSANLVVRVLPNVELKPTALMSEAAVSLRSPAAWFIEHRGVTPTR